MLLVVLRGKFDSTNQKHYPDLGNVASPVWDFCVRFSDVIWRGNAKCWLFSQDIFFFSWIARKAEKQAQLRNAAPARRSAPPSRNGRRNATVIIRHFRNE